ncbi:MAG: hypothetical protein RLZZ450_4154, partial [Pseudomonadota bacterium]
MVRCTAPPWHESWCAVCVPDSTTAPRARANRRPTARAVTARLGQLVVATLLSFGSFACNALLDNEDARLGDEAAPTLSDPASADEAGVSADAPQGPPGANQSLPDTDARADDPAPCTDPHTCPCTTGDATLTAPCGDCGQQHFSCVAGRWSSTDECSCNTITERGAACGTGGTLARSCGADCRWSVFHCDELSDGGVDDGADGGCGTHDPETEQRPCEACGLGKQTRVRTWSVASCTFGAWSEWGVCSGAAGACVPGQIEAAEQSCGSCAAGTQRRTRSCGDACAWGDWTTWSACAGSAQ